MGDDEYGEGVCFQRPRNQRIINLAMKTTKIKYCKILNDWDQDYDSFYHQSCKLWVFTYMYKTIKHALSPYTSYFLAAGIVLCKSSSIPYYLRYISDSRLNQICFYMDDNHVYKDEETNNML